MYGPPASCQTSTDFSFAGSIFWDPRTPIVCSIPPRRSLRICSDKPPSSPGLGTNSCKGVVPPSSFALQCSFLIPLHVSVPHTCFVQPHPFLSAFPVPSLPDFIPFRFLPTQTTLPPTSFTSSRFQTRSTASPGEYILCHPQSAVLCVLGRLGYSASLFASPQSVYLANSPVRIAFL